MAAPARGSWSGIMPRIVSIWLERWPIMRFLRAQSSSPLQARGEPVDPEQPFVLSVEAAGGPRIIAANEAAEAIGLAIGDRLADARARVGGLQIHPADDAADAVARRRLALWCSRYTPSVALWGEEDGADGFFLDVTGTT